MASKIQIKRTTKTFSQLSSDKLDYGEPLLVQSTDGNFLIIGDSDTTNTIPDEKRIIFASNSSNADKAAYFYGGQFHYADGTDLGVPPASAAITFGPAGSPIVSYNGGTAVNVDSSVLSQVLGNTPEVAQPEVVADPDSAQIATVGYVSKMLAKPQYRGYVAVSQNTSSIVCAE